MHSKTKQPIRILVADDESAVLDAYRSVLETKTQSGSTAVIDLKSKLFGKTDTDANQSDEPAFDIVYTQGAEEAVQAVRESIERDDRFAVAFIDMRMPPGPDGVWASSEIRALDSLIDIVISTAYSDVDPSELSHRVPPISKMFYVQKPFHPHEVRQLAIALGQKWFAEKKIQRLAYYDSLTKLPNRELFYTRLEQSIAFAKRQGRSMAVLFLDIDNFKRINDTLGHSVGDELLCETARRITGCLRSSDVATRPSPKEDDGNHIARLGGDEFTVLLSSLNQPEDASMVADRIREELSKPHQLAGHKFIVTPSIGISVFPEDGEDVGALLKNADMAMYFAKRTGRNNVQFFDASMSEAALLRMNLENELRHAIERNEMTLHYQPLLDLATGRIAGLEALLRWQNFTLGNVAPLDFIPVAEDSGLILPIGEWVLRTACRQAKSWRDEGLCLERIAVNVSVLQFNQTDFPDRVKEILQETNLEPSLLELEITESVLMKDADRTIDTLNRLKKIGVQLAIDDFGTGYSSLSYLKQFPIDEDDRAIACAVISMADNLNLGVTAEGVETVKQMNLLQQENCDEAQGYYISRPMAAEDAGRFLRELEIAKAS
jgi:diguanylate cyclase (GGDEF)-like protein